MRKNEIWRPIPGFNGKYFASSFGRVKSIYRETKNGFASFTGTILKPSLSNRRYLTLKLSQYVNGALVDKTYKVHRLVALTFHANPRNKPQVNHKDFNTLNNYADNLEWATAKENTNHAQINGRRPIGAPYIPVGQHPVRAKKIKNTATGEIYSSAAELSLIVGIPAKEIRRRLSNERPNNLPYEYIKGEYTLVYK